MSVVLKEGEVLQLVRDYLEESGRAECLRALEKDAGVFPLGLLSDLQSIRELVFNGRWKDIVKLLHLLREPEDKKNGGGEGGGGRGGGGGGGGGGGRELSEGYKKCLFVIVKQQYLELLNSPFAVEMTSGDNGGGASRLHCDACVKKHDSLRLQAVGDMLGLLETLCPSREDYDNLCSLATLPSFTSHSDYARWSVAKGRLQCFSVIKLWISSFLELEDSVGLLRRQSLCCRYDASALSSSRLAQLLAKGGMYEKCEAACVLRCGGEEEEEGRVRGGGEVLDLCSWIQQQPDSAFQLSPSCLSLSLLPHSTQQPLPARKEEEEERERGEEEEREREEEEEERERGEKEELKVSKSVQLPPSSDSLMFQPPRPTGHEFQPLSAVVDELLEPPISTRLVSHSMPEKGVECLEEARGATARLLATHTTNDSERASEEEKFSVISTKNSEKTQGASAGSSKSEAHRQRPKGKSRTRKRSSGTKSTAKALPPSHPHPLSHHRSSSSSPTPHTQAHVTSRPPDKPAEPVTPADLPADIPEKTQSSKIRPLPKITSASEDPPLPLHSSVLPSLQITPTARGGGRDSSTPKPTGFRPPTCPSPSSSPVPTVPSPPGPAGHNGAGGCEVGVLPAARKHIDFGSEGSKVNSLHWPTVKLISSVTDTQVVRSVAFSKSGAVVAVGSNSKSIRLCYTQTLLEDKQPLNELPVFYHHPKYHRGSIYCLAWLDDHLLASGSNDQSIRLLSHTPPSSSPSSPSSSPCFSQGQLNVHSGTVRDLSFLPNGLLVSGGAGDPLLQLSDPTTQKLVTSFSGHSDQILSITATNNTTIASGSLDGTIRLWDTRQSGCVHTIKGDSPATSLTVSNNLQLASANINGSCSIYDLHSLSQLASVNAHHDECRSVRFSPAASSNGGSTSSRWLLTGSYDSRLCLVDVCGGWGWREVGQHGDKVIQCRWHCGGDLFASTSADRRACFWRLQRD